ncbi:hypothetical protein CLF_113366 [Clonorchis sinensis]|uniref:Uncharacterized protein n=1 Tax=Clonorchis sinensis TaxID=79923 RepID=G7YYA2_CLOSI|nr:hypothetical protein CLF_113366 [Clonorchis sinensis]
MLHKAVDILSSNTPVVAASGWLYNQETAMHPQALKILEQTVSIQKAYPTISRISEGRPLEARKLGHSSPRGKVQNRLPFGAASADPKLMAKLMARRRNRPRPRIALSTQPPQIRRLTKTAMPGGGKPRVEAAPKNIMDPQLRPQFFDADPNSADAEKRWNHRFRTFESYLKTVGSSKPNKLETLIHFVNPLVYDHIADHTDYESAIDTLRKLYVRPKMSYMHATCYRPTGRETDRILISWYKN